MASEELISQFFSELSINTARGSLLQDFFNECARNDDLFSQALAHNFRREVIFQNIPRSELLAIATDLDIFLEKCPKLIPPGNRFNKFLEESAMDKMLLQELAKIRTSPDPTLLCCGAEVKDMKDRKYSNIIRKMTFLAKCLGAEGKDARYKERLADDVITSGYRRILTMGDLEGHYCIWICSTTELSQQKQRAKCVGKEESDFVRDTLALDWGLDVEIFEIRFYEGDLPKPHTPTIFDKGTKYFQPQKQDNEWGRTMNSSNLLPSVEEAVHLPIQDNIVKVKSLGKLVTNPTNIGSNPTIWQDYRKRSDEELERFSGVL